MNVTRSTASVRLRIYAIILGTAILLWLPIEDTNETITIFFAILICVGLVTYIHIRTKKRIKTIPFRYFVLTGVLAGAAITPLSLFLMAFKTGIHVHPFLDYSNQQIASVINRSPIWIVGGFLIASGLGSIVNRRNHPGTNNAP